MTVARRHLIVRAYDGPGTVEVIDRASGEKLGYALQDYWGRWHAHPPYTGEPVVTIGKYRYRVEAVEAIEAAAAHSDGQEGSVPDGGVADA